MPGGGEGGVTACKRRCGDTGSAGNSETHSAALRRGEVEQLQLRIALQGPLQVPQLPVHPGHHRRAAPAGTARGQRGVSGGGGGGGPGRTPTARPRGAGCCAAPGREGSGLRAARCGSGSLLRGRFHGRPRPAARGPLSAARRAAAVRRSGAEGGEKGSRGADPQNGEEGVEVVWGGRGRRTRYRRCHPPSSSRRPPRSAAGIAGSEPPLPAPGGSCAPPRGGAPRLWPRG